MHFLYGCAKLSISSETDATVFPVYLYASYDYGARNIDEYFHVYSIAGQKLKMEKGFSKNLNNCML